MKKISLNKLFSNIDLSAEELPKLHSNDEVSYKNVQKRVIAKIENTEIIESAPNKVNRRGRFILGFGIAAALIAGGVGVAGAVSNAGKNAPEKEIQATIDSSSMEIKVDAEKLQNKDDCNSYAPEFKPFSAYEDVYNYEVEDNLDGISVEEVKYCCENGQTWILVHYSSELPGDISMLDAEFNSLYTHHGNACFGNGYLSNVVMTSECDDNNLYMAYGYLGLGVDPMENKYLVVASDLFRKDTEKITELGMKNLMGFTNSEIAANKEYTADMKARIENEFTKNDGYYYHNEDVIAIGNINIVVDISNKEFDIDKNIIPATMSNIYNQPSKWPDISNNIDELKAEVVSISTSGTLTNVLVKFTPQKGLTLDKELEFEKQKVLLYTIDPDTGVKTYLDDKAAAFDSYKDVNGTTNNDVPCIYEKYEFQTDEISDAYLEVTCEKLVETETNSIISNGNIEMNVYLDDIGFHHYIQDSFTFTTEDGFDIDVSFLENSIEMNWNVNDDKTMPDFLSNASYDGRFYHTSDLKIVMKNSWACPVRMNILVNDDGSVSASGFLIMPSTFFNDEIDCIEYNDKTIYKYID